MIQRRHASLYGLLLVALLGLAAGPAAAQVQTAEDLAPLQFSDHAEQKRFSHLASELRCVMCQNQSLADSNAQIARDMRREVLSLMREGHSDAEVKRFLVERYGEFVLYRPAVDSHTWLLWFGPGLVLLGGGLAVWRIVRRRATGAAGSDKGDGGEQEW